MSTNVTETTSTYTETVADVARAADVATSAVRFYEKHGLLRAVRTSGDARRFEPDAACRIKVAKVAQRVGLTIREIADALATLPSRPQSEHWQLVCQTLVHEAEERMAELRTTLEALGSETRLCEITEGDEPTATHRDEQD